MRVDVRLEGPLAGRLGPRRRLRLPEGARVAELVAALAREAGPGAVVGHVALVGGRPADGARRLADGDEVAVIPAPPAAGPRPGAPA
ncbi:MoaD/ThiS family protein [Miltoncostaea marina]|uniref:MoaD/ThiS family protein n=1 Tax=Miltoncostaea marina TaxID=2843215 RepID=UPI001C3D6F78|nr:MoaD/ThiS family protein [Miltoncostaea marina]